MGIFDGILSAISPGVGSVISGLTSAFGQSQANQSNQDIANQASMFNAQQAQQQMNFQERMSDTAYQRATADMKAAGLNPMLAYQQGGASSPSGQAGSAVMPAPMQNVGAAAAQGANASVQTAAATASVDKISADADQARAAATNQRAQALATAGVPEVQRAEIIQRTASADALRKSIDQMQAEIDRTHQYMSQNMPAEADRAAAGAAESYARADQAKLLSPLEARLTQMKTALASLEMPEAKAYADFYSTKVGRATPYANAGAHLVGSAVGAWRDLKIGGAMSKDATTRAGRLFHDTMTGE